MIRELQIQTICTPNLVKYLESPLTGSDAMKLTQCRTGGTPKSDILQKLLDSQEDDF